MAGGGQLRFPGILSSLLFLCYKTSLDCNGLNNVKFDFLYYQSVYFDFFFPLFILMLGYDLAASALGIRNLASGILVTAERPLGMTRSPLCSLAADTPRC
jgi:hypothetical protein